MISPPPSARLQHARRGGDEVADAVDVEQEAVGAATRGRAAEPGDHDAIRASGGISAWQIATASASASCEVGGISASESSILTIRCTWPLSAWPCPQTDCFTRVGAYSVHSTPGGGGGDHHGAAGLTDGECDARVGPHIRLLDGDGVRRVRRDERLYPLEDHPEPKLRPLARACRPAPGRECRDPPAAFVDDPVAARSRPWVDAENLHGRRVGGRADDDGG